MKFIVPLLLALLAAPWPRLQARENPYDVLGKTLEPIVSVLSPEAPQRGLTLDAHLLHAAKLPPALEGQSLHLALNPPDRLLLSAPILNQMMTVCRNGTDLWATPGSKIQYLLAQAGVPAATPEAAAEATPAEPASPDDSSGDKPKKKKKHKNAKGAAAAMLGPLELPIPDSQLVFLPVLFEVRDAGDEQIGSTPCRVLDVRLMPQLAESLHAENWSARLWVGANYRPAQIAVTGPDWDATAAIDKLAFTERLPDTAFQPTEQDVLRLTPAQFLELVKRLGAK